MKENELLQAALEYARKGWAVFPCIPPKRNTRGEVLQDGKAPATPHGFLDATTNEKQIKRWWNENPNYNIACATGDASGGLLVIDGDQEEAAGKYGMDAIREWETEHGELPETVHVLSGRGENSTHYYFQYDAEKEHFDMFNGKYDVDGRGNGGYVLLPPSLHISGRRYEWEIGYAPGEIEIAAVNDTVRSCYQYFRSPGKQDGSAKNDIDDEALKAELSKISDGRVAKLISLAGTLVQRFKGNIPLAVYRETLKTWNSWFSVPIGSRADDERNKFEKAVLPCAERFLKRAKAEPEIDGKEAFRLWCSHNKGVIFEGTEQQWNEAKQYYLDAERAKKKNAEGTAASSKKENDVQPEKALSHLVTLDSIEAKEVAWFIPGYMPAGQITMLCGDGGSGKTFVWTHIAASISKGCYPDLFGGNPFEGNGNRNVLYFSSEDSTAYVLKERLQQAGADFSHIATIGLEDPVFSEIRFDSEILHEIVSRKKPALVVFDPIQSFIPKELRMAERNAMRQSISPLIGLGEQFGTTFLIISHTNKRHDAWGRNRMADSADIWDIARSVLICGKTGEDDLRYISNEKNSYAEEAQTILFRVTDKGVISEGFTNKKDRDYVMGMQSARNNAPDRDEAKEFILRELHNEEKVMAGELKERAKNFGISGGTFDRARRELCDSGEIEPERIGKKGEKGSVYYWKLKEAEGYDLKRLQIPPQ